MWQNPSDDYDVWQASDTSMFALSGGVRFGGGDRKLYGKVGAGLFFWPETSRVDLFSGEMTPIFASSSGLAFELGVGMEMSLLKVKAFVDLDLWIGPSPTAASEADAVWPGFQAGGGLNVLTIKGGLKIDF